MSCEIVLVSILKIRLLFQGKLSRKPKTPTDKVFKGGGVLRAESREKRRKVPEQNPGAFRLRELLKLVNRTVLRTIL